MQMRRIAALAATLYLVLMVPPASGHTDLINSTPASDSVIQTFPSSVTINFADDLVSIGNSNSISVLDANGQEISQGEVSVSGPMLSKQLLVSEKTGLFKVQYRAVASDGHVITGEYAFTVEATGVTISETEVEPKNSPPTTSENKLSIYLILSATAIAGGLLILIFIWKKQPK
jgi:methionine-rich copper-binding protein CopC